MKKIFLSLILLGFYSFSFSQTINDSIKKKIDELFVKWDNSSSPGCAIGIVRNDSLIYAKGYGMANLENNIPITPETKFYMASVSKQFTGYCIVLLARQGKVKLDEDVHTYLPWVPDFRDKITVRNLLNHTSGLRDDIDLSLICGLGGDGMLTQSLALNIIKRQRYLNFKPGKQYQYSNSNFVLLAEIVKSVSGQSFKSFADSAIFKPLGMNHTLFLDDYTHLIQNRASSYSKVDSTLFANNFQNVYTLGDGGLFSNITDMKKWVVNFYSPKVGDSEDIEQLTQKGILNDGKENSYALGIRVNTYKGWKRYTHTGSLAGYRNYIAIYPDLKIGIIIFSNLDNPTPRDMVSKLTDLFIKDTSTTKQAIVEGNVAVFTDTDNLKKICGNYLSNNGVKFNFVIRNQKLYWEANANSILLLKKSHNTFLNSQDSSVRFVFSDIDTKKKLVTQYLPDNVRLLTKYTIDNSQTEQELMSYTGLYNSPELDCIYGITLKGRQLILTSSKYEDSELKYLGKDELFHKNGLGHLQIIRNKQSKVIGFEIDNGSIMHLRFSKIG